MHALLLIRASALAAMLAGAALAAAADHPAFHPSPQLAALDKAIDWSAARLIAVQDANRCKTLDSFARESFAAMVGRESLPGLSPLASLFEWVFNADAHADQPVIRIKDRGLRIHFSAHLPEAERAAIVASGMMTPRQFADPVVQQRIAELEPRFEMVTAIRRVRHAQSVAQFLDRMLNIVPPSVGAADSPWFTPDALIANLPPELLAQAELKPTARPISNLDSGAAAQAFGAWARLRAAWLSGQAADVQAALDKLAALLPAMAAPGVYPAQSQRAAEAHYYGMGKFTWAWGVYLLGIPVSVLALVTGWRAPRVGAMVLLLAALGLHAYGVGLRWSILGRIPVANMFEAVVASAWAGIALALLAEWFYRTRVFLFAGHAAGFLALVLASYVIPGGGTLTSIPGILDDVMLRIHTVLIITSYALIFVASVIALVYLFGYYFHTAAVLSGLSGVIASWVGAMLWMLASAAFPAGGSPAAAAMPLYLRTGSAITVGLLAAVLFVFVRGRASGLAIPSTVALLVGSVAVVIGDQGFIGGLGATALFGGALWAAGNAIGVRLRQGEPSARAALATAGGALVAAAGPGQASLRQMRPVLAGGAPGDEGRGQLPAWLHAMDWSHLIILNMVFIMLFVGTVLGAVWADYSWGRPWGWDPKEVFALNTWIIYAILIHMRFITQQRGLWTAWLSVLGCLMMAFNWVFVNFYIVGLHSYA